MAIRDAGDGSYLKECRFFYLPHGAIGSPLPTSALTGINIVNHPDWGLQFLGQDGVPNLKIFVRTIGYGGFIGTAEFITSANSTIDSNGFLKAALPILRLFASDDVKPDDGFIKVGFAHVNDKAKNAYAKKIAVGHYEIHGSLGFAKDGWYITLPEDANGNKNSLLTIQLMKIILLLLKPTLKNLIQIAVKLLQVIQLILLKGVGLMFVWTW